MNEPPLHVNPNVKSRTCLKCGRLFDSAGPGNRICPRCQQINDRLPRLSEAQLQKQRGLKRMNGEILGNHVCEKVPIEWSEC